MRVQTRLNRTANRAVGTFIALILSSALIAAVASSPNPITIEAAGLSPDDGVEIRQAMELREAAESEAHRKRHEAILRWDAALKEAAAREAAEKARKEAAAKRAAEASRSRAVSYTRPRGASPYPGMAQRASVAISSCEGGLPYLNKDHGGSPGSGASGKYGFVDGTWNGLDGNKSNGGFFYDGVLYPRALNAPESVQDAGFYILWNDGAGWTHWTPSIGCWRPRLLS